MHSGVGDARPEEDISYASLFSSDQVLGSSSHHQSALNGSTYSPWAPQGPSQGFGASWGFPGSVLNPPAGHPSQQLPQQSPSAGITSLPSEQALLASVPTINPSITSRGSLDRDGPYGGGQGTSSSPPEMQQGRAWGIPPRSPSANIHANASHVQQGPGQAGQSQAGLSQAQTGHGMGQPGSAANPAITPELISALQQLLQQAQQPGADQAQITQAVMQQLQQQLPPDMVMSVLQQASGLQSPQVQPDLAKLSGSAMAHSAFNGAPRGPSPGSFSPTPRMGTSPSNFRSPLAQGPPSWPSNPTAPQLFGAQRPTPSPAPGMGQTGGLPRPGQLSPAEMMMRLQLGKQQRSGPGFGASRPQGILGMPPGNLGARPGLPINGLPITSAGLLGSSSAMGPEQVASLLQGQQARAARPDLAQMLQMQQLQVSILNHTFVPCVLVDQCRMTAVSLPSCLTTAP